MAQLCKENERTSHDCMYDSSQCISAKIAIKLPVAHHGPLTSNIVGLSVVYRVVCLLILGLFAMSLNGCGGGEDGNLGEPGNLGGEAGNLGATASLTWNPVAHHRDVSYTVHYGKQSSGEPGSCNYENLFDVSEPFATITNLEYDATYYFAVSAHDGRRSLCSNEASKVTPAKDHPANDHPAKDHQ